MRITTGASRSYFQQETKWAWESMIDEMADAVGLDPVKFRLMHVSRPGHKLHPYDSLASVEVLEEGAKALDGTNEIRKPAATREGSSADSASGCRSITAAARLPRRRGRLREVVRGQW